MPHSQEEINSFYKTAAEKAAHLEPWRGHFLARKTEAEILTDKFRFRNGLVGLEVGCGNAFQAALISRFCKRVFATDIFRKSKATHYFGTGQVQEFKSIMGASNMQLVSCSCLSLPFNDGYFDFVFSSSVLEHIRNRELALSEIKRVLKPDGTLILTVPTQMPSIYAFGHSFLYMVARINSMIMQEKNKIYCSNDASETMHGSVFKRFLKNHPSFPLPEPHGEYGSVFEEFLRQFPAKWAKLLRRSGFFIEDNFCMNILPWSLIEPFSTARAAQIYAKLRDFHIRNGRKGLANSLGYLTCFIARKRERRV